MAGGNGQFCCDHSEMVRNGTVKSVSARLPMNLDFVLDLENGGVLHTGLPSCTLVVTNIASGAGGPALARPSYS